MRGPGWEHTKEEVAETLERAGLPAEDIDKMWAAYQELRALVLSGEVPDEEAKSAFGELARKLAVRRLVARLLRLPAFKELDPGKED